MLKLKIKNYYFNIFLNKIHHQNYISSPLAMTAENDKRYPMNHPILLNYDTLSPFHLKPWQSQGPQCLIFKVTVGTQFCDFVIINCYSLSRNLLSN
jgi:hypothetical protein